MTHGEVQVRYRCEECGGRCVVPEPLWHDFFAWYDALGGAVSAHAQNDWWAAHGHPAHPPEESLCPVCDGTGWIYRWVAVSELEEPSLV